MGIKAATETKLIVNPVAGANATHRHWPHIGSILRQLGLSYDFQYTEGVGHGIELASEAASNGYRRLVAVGGDGTVNEVVNGILSAKDGRTHLGVVNTGTGSDFVRMLGIPHDYAGGCRSLLSENRKTIDVGIVQCQNDGKPVERVFVNAAGLGFDAEVALDKQNRPPRFRGTIPYVLGLLRTLTGYKNKLVTVEVDGRRQERRILSVVAANGPYFGGGMKVAPGASMFDGLLEVLTVGDFGKLELLVTFPRIYSGTHVSHSKVQVEKAEVVRVSADEPFIVHADGEVLGSGPVTFLPRSQCVSVIV